MFESHDIVGHQRQRDELLQDIATDNVAHAYLFAGPAHVGKFTVARWFAHQLLLRDAPPEQHASILAAANRMHHPDLLILDRLWMEERMEDWDVIAKSSNVPQEHRAKAGVRSDTIGIDDVRVIQDRLHETGTGRHRCCLIRLAERMQDPAANALLKILEEPPEGRIFILTTQSLSSLLPPVVSRTRVLRFQRVSSKDMRPLLEGMPEDDARFVTHLSQGAPGMLRRLREHPDGLLPERQMHAKASAFWQAPLSERLKTLLPLNERSEEGDRLLLHLALTLRERPSSSPALSRALHQFIRGLQTNTHRGLLLEEFALRTVER